MVTTNLPAPVAEFIQAFNARDERALVALFGADAIVADEGHQHHGSDAIASWIESVNTRYQPHVEPREVATKGNKTVLTVQVSGTFPGSPIQLRYDFTLQGNKIRALTIDS